MTVQEAIKNVTTYVYMECENMPQQVIKALDVLKDSAKECEQYREFGTPTQILERIGGLDVELGKYHSLGTVEELKEAREKQIPKKPKHIHEEYEKHQWKKKKNGEVDDWAWGSGFCNGVVCERCGESICVHCNPNYDDEPCIVDKDLCPNCGTQVWKYGNKNYCNECGQKIDWEEGGTSD